MLVRLCKHRIMKNKLCLAVLSLTTLLYIPLIAASAGNLTTTIASRFSAIWHDAPQEKVYLHTDKPYYSAGEDIWFRAHLVNAATHKPDTHSRFVYVELINKQNTVLQRIKIRRDSAGLAGRIRIPAETAADEYVLRAYSNWMLNTHNTFLYQQKVFIGNQLDDRLRLTHSFGSPKNGSIPLSMTLTNSFGTPVSAADISIESRGLITKGQKLKIDVNGRIETSIPLNEHLAKLEIVVDHPGIRLSRIINLPDLNNDFDLQFFPESGVFLNDQMQTLGFKAIGNDGLAADISGQILNQNNEIIAEFKTQHKGMGKLAFKTFPGDVYHAIARNNNGLVKQFNLPPTEAEGIAIQLQSNRGRTYYRLLNQTNIPSDSLYLMIHSRGIVYLTLPLIHPEGNLPESFLPAGVTSYSVIDSMGNTYCERLLFIRNFNTPKISMTSDRNKYSRREPVNLNFKLTNPDQTPAIGSFSISVTDNQLVRPDSLGNNILTYFLLSSDLKGYIENPQEYFRDDSPITREKTDILMLTQGWRRFSTSDLVRGKTPDTPHFLEIGQSVTGRVMNLFNRPARNSGIIMLSGFQNQVRLTSTDSLGRFEINNIEFPDSTAIIIKAQSRSRIADVEIIPDTDIFPSYLIDIPFRETSQNIPADDYLLLSKERYYTEGGMLVINLDELTVTEKVNQSSTSHFYSGMADFTFDQKKLEDYPGMMLLDILAMFPGVQVDGDNVSIRGGGQPLFLVEGIEYDRIDDVKYLQVSEIEDIALFRGASASIFGARGGNGAIAISLKKGTITQSEKAPSIAHITPLGYQPPSQFYVPKYEVDSILRQNKPDLRTTIFWEPKAQTDKNGEINLSFFTADKANNYLVELEGVTADGLISRFTAILKRE